MPVLDISRSYEQGAAFLEADIDSIRTSIETLTNTTKLGSDNLQTNSITASSKVIDSSISTAKIAADSVTTSKIIDNAITTVKILDNNITEGKINSSNITTAKILNSNVTTAKIAASAVTKAKLSAANVQTSSSCGTFTQSTTSASGGPVSVTNLNVTITTNGRPLLLQLIPTTTLSNVGISLTGSGDANDTADADFKLYRDATLVATTEIRHGMPLYLGSVSALALVFPSLSWIEQPAAGTYTYTVKVDYNEDHPSAAYSTEDIVANNVKLIAVEL